jgi:hypothetical protein
MSLNLESIRTTLVGTWQLADANGEPIVGGTCFIFTPEGLFKSFVMPTNFREDLTKFVLFGGGTGRWEVARAADLTVLRLYYTDANFGIIGTLLTPLRKLGMFLSGRLMPPHEFHVKSVSANAITLDLYPGPLGGPDIPLVWGRRHTPVI